MSGNTLDGKRESVTKVQRRSANLNTDSSMLTLPLSSLTLTKSSPRFCQDVATASASSNDSSKNKHASDYHNTEHPSVYRMLDKNNEIFSGFLKDFAINSDDCVSGSGSKSVKSPFREMQVESRVFGRTTDVTEISTGGAGVSGGTIPKTKCHSPSTPGQDLTGNTGNLGNKRIATECNDVSCCRFPLTPPCDTDRNDKHVGSISVGYSRSSSSDHGSTQTVRGCETDATDMTFGDLFEGQTFSFTVGISDKGHIVRNGKGQKKRDHSIGRLHPNKQKYK